MPLMSLQGQGPHLPLFYIPGFKMYRNKCMVIGLQGGSWFIFLLESFLQLSWMISLAWIEVSMMSSGGRSNGHWL